jgi:hypothetical protein
MHRNHQSDFCTAPLINLAARNGLIFKFESTAQHQKTSSSAGKSCNIHGHHNRNFCIIIHLNTSISLAIISSRLAPLPRSDNPSQEASGQTSQTQKHPQNPTRASKRTKTYSP